MNSKFYTNHQLCYEENRRRIQEGVKGMPLYGKLVELFGPDPTAMMLLELGMVTMGGPNLTDTGFTIGKGFKISQTHIQENLLLAWQYIINNNYLYAENIRSNIEGFTGPADMLLVGAAYLAMLVDQDWALEPIPENFPSFFTKSQDPAGVIRPNYGDIACFRNLRLQWLPKKLIQVHAGSSKDELLELRKFILWAQRHTLYITPRIQREFQQLIHNVSKKVYECLAHINTDWCINTLFLLSALLMYNLNDKINNSIFTNNLEYKLEKLFDLSIVLVHLIREALRL